MPALTLLEWQHVHSRAIQLSCSGSLRLASYSLCLPPHHPPAWFRGLNFIILQNAGKARNLSLGTGVLLWHIPVGLAYLAALGLIGWRVGLAGRSSISLVWTVSGAFAFSGYSARSALWTRRAHLTPAPRLCFVRSSGCSGIHPSWPVWALVFLTHLSAHLLAFKLGSSDKF